MEIFGVIAELGFTITAVLGGGVFIVILLKYILASVVESWTFINTVFSVSKPISICVMYLICRSISTVQINTNSEMTN